MFNFPKLSLKASYIITITILTVGPAWLLSTYLIDRFEQIFITNLEEKLSERAQNVGKKLNLELDLLTIQLTLASTDLDLALAVHTGAYGNIIGRKKFDSILKRHKMLSSLLLVDNDFHIIEALPETALLLELDSAKSWLKQMSQSSNTQASNTIIIKAPELVSQLGFYGVQQARTKWQQSHVKPLINPYLLLFYVPLKLSQNNDPHIINPTVGGLIAMIPMQFFIDQLKYSALPTTLNSAKYLGNTLFENKYISHNELLKIQQAISIPGLKSPLRVEFSEQRSSLRAALGPLADDFAKVTLLSLAVTLLLSLVITRLLLKPFNLLARIVTIYANGNYQPITAKTRFKELHNIVRVLGYMAARIKHNQQELEQRVVERTAELQNTNQELEEAMTQLKAMQTQIVEAEKMAQLGNLVAGVAHEINTPVGVALTAASMEASNFEQLKEKLDNNQIKKSDLEQHIESGAEASQMVIRNLKRAIELIGNFKEVAVDQSSEQRRVFNLSSYINEIMSSLRAEMRRCNIKLNIYGDHDLELESYPGALAQILSNFVMNSLKHGFQKGFTYSIDIEFSIKDGIISLTYQDSGKGVDSDTLDKLFIPFFTTARGQGGTGLGLHIVYNLVNQTLCGSIQAISAPGKGMRFELNFPQVTPKAKVAQ